MHGATVKKKKKKLLNVEENTNFYFQISPKVTQKFRKTSNLSITFFYISPN